MKKTRSYPKVLMIVSLRIRKLLWILLLSPLLLTSQVEIGNVIFNKIPKNLQLVSRDAADNDRGIVLFSGQVDELLTPYDSLKIKVFRHAGIDSYDNGDYLDYYLMHLDYDDTSNKADFNFSIKIDAELMNYSFEVIGVMAGSQDVDITIVKNIVAGDVYVIQGQSNAVAKKRLGSANANIDPFIRSYSNGTDIEANLFSDDEWYVTEGDRNNAYPGSIGQWGLKLAKMIVDDMDVSFPVAIINGARDGRGISYFLENNRLGEDGITNNYERLKYRLESTALSNKVKAIFWSQGENTGDDNIYKDLFLELRDSWKRDYSGLKKIYVFQTRNSCNSNGSKKENIKESQRQLGSYEDIVVMPTDGIVQVSDGCHFEYSGGYQRFATRIYPIVKRDFYTTSGSNSVPADIEPPHVLKTYLTDETTLVIETDADDLIKDALATNNFIINSGVGISITNTKVSGNKIVFTLSGYPGDDSYISNVGNAQNISQNFITNSMGIELLNFNEISIDTSLFTVWRSSSWSNGIPDANKYTIFDSDYSIVQDLETKDLTINTGIEVDFDGNSTKSIIVNGDLVIKGSLIIGDTESLLITNTESEITVNGSFKKKEKTTNLKSQYDVTYFSSPVENANLSTTFPGVDPNRVFYYDPDYNNTQYTGIYKKYRHWRIAAGSMLPGKGYSVDGRTTPPNGYSYPNYEMEVVFVGGKPNHGDILVPISKYTTIDGDYDRTNLLGNPYPAAIDADLLINENTITNDVFDGTLYLWDHSEDYIGGQYTADYLTYNLAGSVPGGGSGSYSIASGQGFMILTDESNATFSFKNAMQVAGRNNQFYKGVKKKDVTNSKQDKAWLQISHENYSKKEILIAFCDNAGIGFDKGYDGKLLNFDGPVNFYSLIGDGKYTIQGLNYLEPYSEVSLGIKIENPGEYRIELSRWEGNLELNSIYILDRDLKIKHDLKVADYVFLENEIGDNTDRFKLVFRRDISRIIDNEKNDLRLINQDNAFTVQSERMIEEINVFNILGVKIGSFLPDSNDVQIQIPSVRKGSILFFEIRIDGIGIIRKKAIQL